MLRRRIVELAPRHAALRRDHARLWVDARALHLGEVDHHRAVRDREPADVVAPAADRDLGARRPREADRRRGVGGRAAADDQRGPPVDHPVVDASRLVVAAVAGAQDRAAHLARERLELRGVERRRRAHPCLPSR